jgi:hypothetical protein
MRWSKWMTTVFVVLLASLPLLGCGVLAWAASPLATLVALALLALAGLVGCSGSGREDLEKDPGADVLTMDLASDDAVFPESDVVEPMEIAEQDLPDPTLIDTDKDGIVDAEDNCPLVSNPEQEDADASGYGDACEALEFISPCCGPECFLDSDGDMIPDALDLCPWTVDLDGFEGNMDSDGDSVGDGCDESDDFDGDGIPDLEDNCPRIPNPGQENSDGDGECDIHGDACDLCDGAECLSPCGEICCYDADGDGYPGGWLPMQPISCGGLDNSDDNCPLDANEDQADKDFDGVGDVCDNCPEEPNPDQWDVNGDGMGDACSTADLSWQDRQPQREQTLSRFLVARVITPANFLDIFEGSPEAARVALAAALRDRFQQDGVLPHGQA